MSARSLLLLIVLAALWGASFVFTRYAVPALGPFPLTFARVALAVACTALAYLIYFRLIADVGPTRALTVTFLIPLFGVLWGRLFLGEAITPNMLAGGVLIVAGTWLALRGNARSASMSAAAQRGI